MIRKLLVLGSPLALLAVFLSIPAVANAQPAPNFGSPPSGSIPILFNDTHVYAKPDVLKQDRVLAALVRNGTILVPLRSMFEQMGATVSYDPSTQTVTASKSGASVAVTVGKPEVVINGESRPLDVPPIMYQGQILVPVRVISEGMGAYVQWVQDRHIVVVRYITATPPPPPPPSAPPPPPPPPPTPTPWSWNGVYVGLNAGEVWNHDTGVAYCVTPATATPPSVINGLGCSYPSYGMMNGVGLIGGVQAGWNIQLGPLVIGPELEYDGTTLNPNVSFQGCVKEYGFSPCGQGSFTASETMTSFQSERLRFGFASGRTLIYVTGGWAQSHWNLMSNQLYATCAVCVYPTNVNVERSGWTEGLGGEWAIAPRLSMKVEGLLYEMQPYSTLSAANPVTGFQGGKDFYFHGGIARIGFNWRL